MRFARCGGGVPQWRVKRIKAVKPPGACQVTNTLRQSDADSKSAVATRAASDV